MGYGVRVFLKRSVWKSLGEERLLTLLLIVRGAEIEAPVFPFFFLPSVLARLFLKMGDFSFMSGIELNVCVEEYSTSVLWFCETIFISKVL